MGIMSRVLVPFLIVALPIAAMIAYVAYYFHEKNKLPAAPVAEHRTPAASFGTDTWPVFRGDAALTGAAEGTLPDALALKWQFETRGAIKSTPVIAEGKVFFTSTDWHLYAADLKTGREVWWFKANDELEASPLYADGKVFMASALGTFFAVDAEDGLVVWTFDAGGRILGAPNTFVDEDGGKRRIVFGSYDNFLYCLDAEDGGLVWKHEAKSFINGAAAVADGSAVFGSCDGRLYIVPLDAPDNAQTVDIEAYMASSPAVFGGVVYAGNYEGLFLAVALSNREVLWRFRQQDVPFVAAPAVTADRVLLGGRDNTLYCLNRADGTVVWTFSSTGRIDSSPVVCGDRVVFGSDNGRLTIVDLADGRETFTYTLGKPVSAGPAIARNTLLVGCEDGVLYAFGPVQPEISP